MPGRDGTGPISRGFGYGMRYCRNEFSRGGCLGYGIGYRYKTRKEYLQEQKDFFKKRIEEIDEELDNLN